MNDALAPGSRSIDFDRAINNPTGSNALLPLQVKDLGYSIKNNTLLQNINLEVTTSSITAILGHNGAGKSLLLRLLHGLIPPTTGSVNWQSLAVTQLHVRKKQAMVFQKPVVLRRSVASNIDYVLALRNAASDDTRNALLSDANLLGKANQQATSLSGGEQQRLAIARALATNPSVMFLDEPTASMDPAATAAIEEQLRLVSLAGIKIIIVTHDIMQARRLANDIVFLHHGTVTEHTVADDFFSNASSSAARQYLDGQL